MFGIIKLPALKLISKALKSAE
ncbi:unnamed protein product, partial [Rotaria sordida]